MVRLVPGLSLATTAGIIAVAGSLSPVPGFGAAPAQAQFWWNDAPSSAYRRRVDVQRARLPRRDSAGRIAAQPKPSAEELAASKATASGPLMVAISLSSQRMTVYDASGQIMSSPISSGQAGHRTPTGVFSIIQKNRHHRSNIYSGAPMPYMQRITWSGIALHAGALPGYPASHGCIRLPYPVAAKLFAMSRMGMRVVIGHAEPKAGAFSHPELPEPLMVAQVPEPGRDNRADAEQTGLVRVATSDGAAPVATRFLNPMQHAAQERVRARTRVAEAVKANKALLEASLKASAEANAAAAALRSAQAGMAALKARVDAATAEARPALEAQLAEAQRNLDEAAANDNAKNRAAYDAAKSSREAEEAQAAAEEAVKIAERGTEPIAVLISRREGKVLVRQGMTPLFEAPVTFKEPGRPLGTHVFQVMSADNDTGRLGWKSVTMPEGSGFTESLDNRAPVRRGERTVQTTGVPSDAKGALERVEMSPDVKRRIAERLWINGSIVISDHGLGTETGKGTDFIVQTN